MRTRTIIGLCLTTLVAVAAVASVVVARAYATRPVVASVSPAPGTVVNRETPIRIVLRSPEDAKALRVEVDGRDVTPTAVRTDAGWELPLPVLEDGVHTVTVDVESEAPVGPTSSYRWSFSTDGTAPRVALDAAADWAENARIDGQAEPGATLTATWPGGRAYATADASGRFTLLPAVEEGETPVLVTAVDAAGNEGSASHTLRYDAARPAVRIGGVEEWVTDTDRPELYAFVDDASPTTIVAKVNGQEAKVTPLSIGYVVETSRLPQGTSTLSLEVTDALGRTTTRSREFGVDTTDRLTNDLTLAPGAKGKDVARLTRRLKGEKVWTGKPSWVYDEKVEAAVRAYQKRAGLPQDGIARPALLTRTAGRVVVIKSKFVLNLWLDGKLAKQYRVAIGQPQYPTPTGSYVITDMIENPTWIPPNSPWAAGLEPVPPGASNPLGTRWIGTSAPLIGIHGTPQGWSIGSMASHGCIRMHIPEVEELFEKVTVGMPIEIKE